MNYNSGHQLLHAWGAFKLGGTRYIHATKKSWMSTMSPAKGYYWRKCVTCKGRGCRICGHRGKKRVQYTLIDPRMIAATGPGGMYVVWDVEPPTEFQLVDALLMEMALPSAAALTAYYVHYPGHGREYTQRLTWTNARLVHEGLPKLPGIHEYRERLKHGRSIVSKAFDLPVMTQKERSTYGGKACTLTKEQRKKRAQKAATKRWNNRPTLTLPTG